jgi:hypothetical protein
MATVVKCDQCGKIDTPTSMVPMDLELGSNRATTQHISGDFCSQECVVKFITKEIQKVWYNAKNNY